jgi:phospho-N-acetylmuramoyl-pentapeptide-transferase
VILELLRFFPGTTLENLFQYLTFRAALAAVVSFLVAILAGPRLIAWLRARRIGEQTGKTDSAKLAELHKEKAGTPTMGGVLIMLSLFVAVGAFGDWRNRYVALAMAGTLALTAVGFLDDWIKLNRIKESGLKARSKLALQIAVCIALSYSIFWVTAHEPGMQGESPFLLRLPFLKDSFLDLSFWGGAPYVLFAAVVMISCSNAVNLTDGLDGLATGCSVMATLAMTILVYVTSRFDYAKYLLLPHVPGAAELTIVGSALAGACLGFLWFNAHPAEVFMGDTGSLPIGGLLGFLAVVSRSELILPIIGGVFVMEALSVILQVGSFKLRGGKRIFRIAPLHHHFQFGGWHEVKVVTRFWIVGAICAIVGLATLKVR